MQEALTPQLPEQEPPPEVLSISELHEQLRLRVLQHEVETCGEPLDHDFWSELYQQKRPQEWKEQYGILGDEVLKDFFSQGPDKYADLIARISYMISDFGVQVAHLEPELRDMVLLSWADLHPDEKNALSAPMQLHEICRLPVGGEFFLKISTQPEKAIMVFLVIGDILQKPWGEQVILQAASSLPVRTSVPKDQYTPTPIQSGLTGLYQETLQHFLIPGHEALFQKILQANEKRIENAMIAKVILANQVRLKTQIKDNAARSAMQKEWEKYEDLDPHERMVAFINNAFSQEEQNREDLGLQPIINSLQEEKTSKELASIFQHINNVFRTLATEEQLNKFLMDPATEDLAKVKKTVDRLDVPWTKAVEWSLHITRNLYFAGKPPTQENVQQALREHQEMRETWSEKHLFRGRNVVVAAHGETGEDWGGHRFGVDALMQKILKDQQGSGELLRLRPDANNESIRQTKQATLEQVRTAKSPFTLVLDGHGSKNAFYFSDGQIPGVTNEVVDTAQSVKITVDELFAAYQEGVARRSGSKTFEPDIIISHACFASNFLRDFLARCTDAGIPQPVFLAPAEYGQYGVSKASMDTNTALFDALLSGGSASPATMETVWTLGGQRGDTNLSLYVPGSNGAPLQLSAKEAEGPGVVAA